MQETKDPQTSGRNQPRKSEPINHDTFDDDGQWRPPDGAELFFHSGFSEPTLGLERDGLGRKNNEQIIRAVVDFGLAAERMPALPGSEREREEERLALAAIRAAISST